MTIGSQKYSILLLIFGFQFIWEVDFFLVFTVMELLNEGENNATTVVSKPIIIICYEF